MGTICRPSDYGSGFTDTTAFIQCINGREPHINKLWCLGLNGVFCKVHTFVRVEIPSGTVGEFVTDYLAENGRLVEIIGEISVNGNVQFLGLSDQVWVSGLPYISNLLDQFEAKGWVSYNNYNQI